ncbi:hypothetical protein BGZ61DRAFT_487654 [Ilyonectria robusta]|uniref:uncharacterized protein n=1 Tax=Ilyonectria robusta TaxID=1079257 RepID=UPI001E8DE0A4|nr:uncharacterized protein BGZ61DRAFT_487654 [Ilyonectria robusta]KAH8651710.1 hypothetical protein BGZ61DRAFT_487654 [Ilyonectria robusta]
MNHPLKIKQWNPSKPKRKPNLRARNPELRPVLSDASFAQSIACDAENPWPFVGGEDLANVDPYADFPSIEEIIDEVIRSATSDSARDSIDTPNHTATPKAISNSIPPYPGGGGAGDSVKTLSLQNDTPNRGSNSQEIAIAMDKDQGICEMSPKHTIAPVATPDSIPGRQVDLDDLAGGMPTASKNVVPPNAPLPLVLGGEAPDNNHQSLSVLAQPPPAATEVENHTPQEEHSDSTEHGDTLEVDHCGDIVESTPTESGFGYASPYPTDTSLSSGSTTPSTPPSPSLLSKDETLRNPIQVQGTSGPSGLVPMAMDLNQHASCTQEPEVCSSRKQPVDDMIGGGRGRCGGDVEPCSTGLGGSRAPTPRRRARGSYILHGDYYESDDGDGDDDDFDDERGQQSPEPDGTDRSRRCSGSVPIEALLADAKYRRAQSTEDSERDHDGDEDEDEAYGKRRRKRRRSHEPLASIKRRRYGHTTRQCPTNTTRSVPRDRTPTPRMLSPSSSYTTSDDSDTGHDFATFREWQLDNVILKRVVLNGVATFQLQFGWDMCSKHDNAVDAVPDRRHRTSTGSTGRVHRGEGAKAKFTPEEDRFLLDLKEGEDGQSSPHLTWSEIYRRFNARFPGRRSCGSLQVHYCTKLKGREEP